MTLSKMHALMDVEHDVEGTIIPLGKASVHFGQYIMSHWVTNTSMCHSSHKELERKEEKK